MKEMLPTLIFAAGIGHFCILIAAALVPFKLKWRDQLQSLSRLHRQMYWVYGGYVVLSIVSFGVISTQHSAELASGSGLARGFCLYVAIFWGIRLVLQGLLDIKPHLSDWVLKVGNYALTAMFAFLTAVFGWAAFFPVGDSHGSAAPHTSRSALEPGESKIHNVEEAIQRFREVRNEVRLPPKSDEEIVAHRELKRKCFELFNRSLTPREKLLCVVFGETDSLDQDGGCWLVNVSTELTGGQMACFDDTGRLLLAWGTPEG